MFFSYRHLSQQSSHILRIKKFYQSGLQNGNLLLFPSMLICLIQQF